MKVFVSLFAFVYLPYPIGMQNLKWKCVWVSVCSHRWFFCRNAKATVNKLHTHTQMNGEFLSDSRCEWGTIPRKANQYIRLVVMEPIYYESTFIGIILCIAIIAKRKKQTKEKIDGRVCKTPSLLIWPKYEFHLRSEFYPFSSQSFLWKWSAQNISSHPSILRIEINLFILYPMVNNKLANPRTNKSNFFPKRISCEKQQTLVMNCVLCACVCVYLVPKATETAETYQRHKYVNFTSTHSQTNRIYLALSSSLHPCYVTQAQRHL